MDDPARYVFVDLGSGKGRMLLIAAERPFREIQGIEFAAELHREAEANIKRYRSSKQRCKRIRSLALNAADYAFPRDDLVIYLFNSFGRAVMEQVLDRLEKSLENDPRDVILVMLFPGCAFLVDARARFRLYKQTRRYRIYRSCVSASSAVSDPSASANG
jgi:cyclopropane fatty-acyl-phospholipid synthase-like methyltransferase